jgi:hypothetical protein
MCVAALLLLLLLLLLQLRFNKVAELIHNSTYHRNLERASVTVYFQEIIDKVCGAVQGLLTGAAASSGQHTTGQSLETPVHSSALL